MEVVNFPAIIEKHGILTPADIDPVNDLILIGKKVNDLRDGSQYQNRTTTISDLLAGVVPVAPAIPYANTLFVDLVNGNDGTGLTGRFDRPFATVSAALTAAVAGQTVRLRPGIYFAGTIVFKDMVNFYCEAGVELNSTGFSDGGVAITANLYGYAKFVGFAAPLVLTASSTVNFEFDTINVATFWGLVNPSAGTAKLTVSCNSITSTGAAGFGFTARSACDISINIRDFYYSNHANFFFRIGFSNFSGSFYCKCPDIRCTGSGTYAFNCGLSMSQNVDPAASIVVDGNITMTGLVYGNGVNAGVFSRAGLIRINGNIVGGAMYGVATDRTFGGSGNVVVTGSISSNRQAVNVNHDNVPVFVQQGLIQSLGLGSTPQAIALGVGYPGGLPNSANNRAYFKDCRIQNLVADCVGIDQFTVGNIPYFYDCEAIGVGAFVTAPGAASAGFVDVRANVPNAGTITDLFTPTGFIADAALVIPNF